MRIRKIRQIRIHTGSLIAIRALTSTLAILLALSGCTTSVTQQAKPPADQATPTATPAASATASSMSPTCPLTIPNGSQPPNSTRDSGWHGNGALWVDLWPYSVVFITPNQVTSDGSLSMKFSWVRGPKTIGPLTIEGRRLDAPAPPLQSESSSLGYGDKGFLPTSIIFPIEGCWEVTGKAGGASLTFVTLVLKFNVNPYIAP